ncbi:MAG: beta-xylosidase, partial [Chloroflexi bacterium]
NLFRMLGQMGGDRVRVASTGALSLEAVRDSGVREHPDVAALASRSEREIAVLVWNYHDDDLPAPPAPVDLRIDGVPIGEPTITHYRIDAEHSNAYEVWKKLGSPQSPTASQYRELERAGQLQLLEPARRVPTASGRVVVTFALPRQGVSLVKLAW